SPYDLQPGLYSYTCREMMIQEGKFAEMAKHDRALADIEEAELKRLSAGPVEEFDRLFVCGWHRRRSLARWRSHQLKLEDILEIPTGLPVALPWPCGLVLLTRVMWPWAVHPQRVCQSLM